MRLLLRQVTVHGILLDEVIMEHDTPRVKELCARVGELLKSGIVFSRDQVETALSTSGRARRARHALLQSPHAAPRRPRRFYCQRTSYGGAAGGGMRSCDAVCAGGLGGLGLELAHWMVQRGARHLVLVSRRGVTTGYQARRLQQWRAKGVRALVRTDDASTRRGAEALLRAAGSVAPVAAIFNLAVVLRDALLENQTAAAFAESFRCKATAAVQLDAASRRLCPRLRHFVLFSSVSCGRGNAGQTNYGLANAVMERVARARRAAGLPATAVQWGAVGDVGLVADMRDDDRVLEIGGTLQQRLTSCLDTHAVVASMV
ncbi:Fatty acid synthase, partial [Gryllus bimaculatus]